MLDDFLRKKRLKRSVITKPLVEKIYFCTSAYFSQAFEFHKLHNLLCVKDFNIYHLPIFKDIFHNY